MVGICKDYITPKRRQGLYLVYKRHFSCQLGDYILPIPPFTFEPEKSIDVRGDQLAGWYNGMKFAQVNGNKNQLEPINCSISGKGGREIHSTTTRTHNVSFTLSITQNRTCDRKGPGSFRNSLYRYLVFGFPVIHSINICDESQLMYEALNLRNAPKSFYPNLLSMLSRVLTHPKTQKKNKPKRHEKHTKKTCN